MTIRIENKNITDAPNLEKSESDEPPMEETLKEESPIVPTPKKQSKKQQEYVACPHCNKSTLLKTFKYYHSYKCKPEAPPPIEIKQTLPDKIEVSSNEFQNKSKKDQRNETIKRLTSRAF